MTQENTNEPKTFKVRITKNNPSRGYWYDDDDTEEVGKEYNVFQFPEAPNRLRINNDQFGLWIESSDCELIQDTPEPFMFQGYPLNVGDKLWRATIGFVEVLAIDIDSEYPIRTSSATYTRDGMVYDDRIEPSIFWDKPQFELPKKPEPKVKKYLVLFKDVTNEFKISKAYYVSLVEFERIVPCEPIQLILESAKEF